MSPVERLFSEPAGPTVVSCDWCGAVASVCTAAERQVEGPPARIGLCEEHYQQLMQGSGDATAASDRAAYERRRRERDAELRRQRSDWQRRKAARQLNARGRDGESARLGRVDAPGSSADARPLCPQDSEELVMAVMQGERTFAPVETVDPRLEDPRQSLERLQEALRPLVQLAEECGVFIDCNPSQTHSVMVVGEVPVQALFRARDLLKRER
jgi:hypothetical protein